MNHGEGKGTCRSEFGESDSQLSQALRHLRSEPLPEESMRRALLRAEQLAASDSKSSTARKSRRNGFDRLEDRRALSGWGTAGMVGDGVSLDDAYAGLLDVVAVVTTDSMRPIMSTYSTQSAAPALAGRGRPSDWATAPDRLLDSDVRMAAIDLDDPQGDPTWEELLGTLVSTAV